MMLLRIPKFDLRNILKWFSVNLLKLGSGKFEFMLLGTTRMLGTNTNININLLLEKNNIKAYQEFFLFGITIDNKLSFKMHIDNFCRTTKYKLHTLQSI